MRYFNLVIGVLAVVLGLLVLSKVANAQESCTMAYNQANIYVGEANAKTFKRQGDAPGYKPYSYMVGIRIALNEKTRQNLSLIRQESATRNDLGFCIDLKNRIITVVDNIMNSSGLSQ